MVLPAFIIFPRKRNAVKSTVEGFYSVERIQFEDPFNGALEGSLTGFLCNNNTWTLFRNSLQGYSS